MDWNLLPFFEDEQISATPITITETVGSDGYPTTTETAGTAIRGLKWNRSVASRYFNLSWDENVTAYFLTDSLGLLTNNAKLTIGGATYEIDSIDNIAEQGAAYLIGLRARR